MTTRILIGLILLWFCTTTLWAAPAPLTVEVARSYLIQWEGKTNTVISRPNGERVVGIGHNVAFDRVVQGRYTDAEIERLFVRDFVLAIGACRRGITRFDELPLEVRLAALSVSFSVGPTGFMRFKNFRRCLSIRFYEGAATELVDSRWWHQVSARRANAALRAIKAQIR